MLSFTSVMCAYASVVLGCSGYHQDGSKTSRIEIPLPKAKHIVSPSKKYRAETLRLFRTIPTTTHQGTYATGKLAKSTVSDLYASYLGYRGVVPKKLTVNWDLQLAKLWKRKNAISRTTAVRDTGDMLVAEYERLDPLRMSLGAYQKLAGREAKLVYRSLTWDMVARSYSLDARKLALLKRVSKRVNGKVLIAYGMTELFPSSGSYSYAYLDFLLRHAGRRYVESLPALHDPLTSFGTFQFTSKAVYDVGSGAPVGGASLVSRALPRSLQIPGSVQRFRGNYHLRAAYLFSVANFATLIRRLDDRQLATFERVADMKSSELAQFIATAHNKPEVAYKAAMHWLNAKARPDYRDSCPNKSQRYADKTSDNYESLGQSFAIASN